MTRSSGEGAQNDQQHRVKVPTQSRVDEQRPSGRAERQQKIHSGDQGSENEVAH